MDFVNTATQELLTFIFCVKANKSHLELIVIAFDKVA